MKDNRQAREKVLPPVDRQLHPPRARWMRRTAATMVFLGLCLVGILFFGLLFAPNKTGTVGFKQWEYRREAPQSIDMLMLGSSFMYASYSPMQAWADHGITSYVAAGPEQSMNTTWATFRNCLATQSPKVVVVELRGISFVDKATADAMEAPVTGWIARLDAAMQGRKITTWPTVFYDFFTYHSRWKDIRYADYVATGKILIGQVEPAFFKGYVYLTEAAPQERRTDWEPHPIDQAMLDANLPYLDAIVSLAREHGAEPVFLMTPAAYARYFDNYLDVVRTRYPGIPVWNLNEVVEEMGMDMTTDFFDSGHLNVGGAAKVTAEITARLAPYALPDHRGDPAYATWDRDLVRYREAIADP